MFLAILWNVVVVPIRMCFPLGTVLAPSSSSGAAYTVNSLLTFDFILDIFLIVDTVLRARYVNGGLNDER